MPTDTSTEVLAADVADVFDLDLRIDLDYAAIEAPAYATGGIQCASIGCATDACTAYFTCGGLTGWPMCAC